MGRKSKPKLKPFCYYCDRQFDDEMVLVTHQKAKHFKCHHCQKKLGSAHSLTVHVFQVHKETLKGVPNAKKGRDNLELGIFGMQNIPEEVLSEKHSEQFGGQPPVPKKARKEEQIATQPAQADSDSIPSAIEAPAIPQIPANPPGKPYPAPPYGAYAPPTMGAPTWSPPLPPPVPTDPTEQIMIYSDELFSVEEKRAMLSKYKGQNGATSLNCDVNSLQESIQERLRSLQAAGASV